MKTVVFILRHSEPFEDLIFEYNSNEADQIKNEKNPLSINGEIKAKAISEFKELQNIEIVYSSHYVRTMSTAKYIAENNNIKLNIDSRFGEIKFGLKKDELPKDFFGRQFIDVNYKLDSGESLNDTKDRMTEGLYDILNKNNGKKIIIVTHRGASSALFMNWCSFKLNYDKKLIEIYFNDKLMFDGNWDTPELFKLEFEGKELKSIKNIKSKKN